MPAWTLGGKHGWMTSGVGFHYRLWKTYMVGRDRACYALITVGKHTRSDDVDRDMPSLPLDGTHGGTTSARYAIIALGHHIRLENVRRGIPSWPLSRTHGVACYHRPWITYTVELRRAWHSIIALRMITRLDDVRHVMPSL
ncbi:hypothetical protein EJD97_011764, partial [Solanum chilense]